MPFREYCKSKIHGAVVTEANLHYAGSITIDQRLLKLADLRPWEKVQVVNLNNGRRLETYIIPGRAGSGVICLNGPAARCGCVGDRVHVISYHLLAEEEKVRPPVVLKVDERNRPLKTRRSKA